MGSWITFTEANVFPRQAELNDIKVIKLPDGTTGDQVVAEAISQEVASLVGYLRSAVAKGYLKRLGPAGTVPPTLVGEVAVLVRRASLGRLPGMEFLHGQIREDEVASAERKIRDVTTGAHRVDEDEADVPQQAEAVSVPLPAITPRCRQFKREDESGI